MKQNNKVLTTGGSGFIGSALVRRLLESGDSSVVNVDKLTYSADPAALKVTDGHPNYQFYHKDICDTSTLRSILQDFKPDAVIHLAAESHVDRSISGAAPFIQSNIVGTFSLLEACQAELSAGILTSAFRFLHVSTDEVYGSLELSSTTKFFENSNYQPSSPYSASKASSDMLVRAWIKTYGFPAIITHSSNNYGPFQNVEKFMPLLITHCIAEKSLPVYGSGQNVRDWLYVDDHVNALLLVLQIGVLGETYNIGGECERDNLSVVRAICALMDIKKPRSGGAKYADLIEFVPDRKGHDLRYSLSIDKIRNELGFNPKTDFASGLEKTIDWYLTNYDLNRA